MKLPQVSSTYSNTFWSLRTYDFPVVQTMKMHMAACIDKTAFGVDHHENRGPHAALGRALGMRLVDPDTNRDVVCVALTN